MEIQEADFINDFWEAFEYLLQFDIAPKPLLMPSVIAGVCFAQVSKPDHPSKASAKYWVVEHIKAMKRNERRADFYSYDDWQWDTPRMKALKDTEQFKIEVALVMVYLDQDGGMLSHSRKRGWHSITKPNYIVQELHESGLSWATINHVETAQKHKLNMKAS